MRTITTLLLFVTGTWASTRHRRENVRKRTLKATTPYGSFDDQEHDYILSIIPPSAMHHKSSRKSTKSTSSSLERASSKSKKSKGKGSKSEGKGKESKSEGKGKGKKDSKKSSHKETPCPDDEPTMSPVLEESVPTQSPVVSPETTSPVATAPPQLSPTSTVSPTTRPTLETQQAPTNLPTPVSASPTNLPTTADVPRTSLPTPSFTPSTSLPTIMDALPTSLPISLPVGDFETTLNLDDVPPRFHSAFQNAATKWDSIIVGDLEDYPIFPEDRTNPDLLCDGDTLPEIVDDVFICVKLPNIDGEYGILGSAGPIYGRIGEFVQTSVGYMEFDLADIELLAAQGRLDGLILHEMAHVYGTGTLWEVNGLVADTPACPYLYDSRASEEYRALSGCDTAVPIETTGGSGTACLHWAESCFQTELMTGVNTGDQELSRISIATLEDMGYVVDYSQADPFSKDQLNPSCVCGANLVHENEFHLPNGASMTFRWNEDRRSLRHDGSDKEREEAIQYGKKKIQDNHRSAELMLRNTDPRRIYLADKVVLVLYFDKDEQIQSVVVTSDV